MVALAFLIYLRVFLTEELETSVACQESEKSVILVCGMVEYVTVILMYDEAESLDIENEEIWI